MIPLKLYVDPKNFPFYTFILIIFGLIFTLWFLTGEINRIPAKKSFLREFLVISLASLCLGFGFISFLLSCSVNL